MAYDGDCGIGKPSGRARSAGPKPVPYTVSSSPDFAGASAVTGEPSSWTAIAIAWPFDRHREQSRRIAHYREGGAHVGGPPD